MTDDRLKNLPQGEALWLGAVLDLGDRARDYLDYGEPARTALIIGLKNFHVANHPWPDKAMGSMRDAAREPR